MDNALDLQVYEGLGVGEGSGKLDLLQDFSSTVK